MYFNHRLVVQKQPCVALFCRCVGGDNGVEHDKIDARVRRDRVRCGFAVARAVEAGHMEEKSKKKNSSFETNHPHLRGCVMGVCTVRGREDIRVKGKRKKRERVTGFFLLAYETRHRPEATCSHGAEGRKRIYLYTYFQTKIYCVNNMATGWVGGEEGVREKRVGRG